MSKKQAKKTNRKAKTVAIRRVAWHDFKKSNCNMQALDRAKLLARENGCKLEHFEHSTLDLFLYILVKGSRRYVIGSKAGLVIARLKRIFNSGANARKNYREGIQARKFARVVGY